MGSLPRVVILLIGFVVGAVIGAILTLISSHPELQSTADTMGGFATAIATIFGIPALLLAWMEINSNIKSQNEVLAYSMYGEQLRLGLNYPKLVNADPKEISGRPEEYQQYIFHLLY